MSFGKRAIYDAVKRLDLVAYIEQETSFSLNRNGNRYTCNCPMPGHRDRSPSFSVVRQYDGIYLFHCFGCGAGGTIVDFCMQYHSLDNPSQAIVFLVKKFNIATDQEFLLNAVRGAKVTINEQKRLECHHIAAATACRLLLRKFPKDERVNGWVGEAYRKMNQYLDQENLAGIDDVAGDASVFVEKGFHVK